MRQRKRIKQKVVVEVVVKQLNKRQETYTNAIKDVMRATGKNYREAKKHLSNDLKIKSMFRELKSI